MGVPSSRQLQRTPVTWGWAVPLWLSVVREHGSASLHPTYVQVQETSFLRQVVVTADAVVVFLDSGYKPRRLPEHIRQLMLSGQPRGDAQGLVSWTG